MEGSKRYRKDNLKQVAEDKAEYNTLTPSQIAKKIDELEAKMYQHSRNLEFEDAARTRDEIHKWKDRVMLGG